MWYCAKFKHYKSDNKTINIKNENWMNKIAYIKSELLNTHTFHPALILKVKISLILRTKYLITYIHCQILIRKFLMIIIQSTYSNKGPKSLSIKKYFFIYYLINNKYTIWHLYYLFFECRILTVNDHLTWVMEFYIVCLLQK